jgi:hypothetical protein
LGLLVALSLLVSACDQLFVAEIVEADPTLPHIKWVSPVAGATLAGSVTFTVAEDGGADVAGLTFNIGGHSETVARGVMSYTVNMETLGIAPGSFDVSVTAISDTGTTRTIMRTFVRPAVPVPSVAWERPNLFEAIEQNRQFDMTVRVSDVSGTITELVFLIDGNVLHTMRNVTDVATDTNVTFRWLRGFDEPLGRVELSVQARNAAGGVAVATREILSIPARPAVLDTVKPLVWWDQATVWQNRAIAGTHVFMARAQDDVQVAYFDFLINNALVDRQLAQSDTSTNLPRRWAQWSWNTMEPDTVNSVTDGNVADTRKYPDGAYTVTVVAVDTSGNRSELETLTVRVANDDTTNPVAEWLTVSVASSSDAIYDGKILTSVTDITFLGSDNNSVVRFELSIGGTVEGYVNASNSALLGYPFSATYALDTGALQNGAHTLSVVAIDQAGNRSVPVSVDVVVVNDAGFRVLANRSNYVSAFDASVGESRTDYGRVFPVLLEVVPGDVGVALTICAIQLTASNSATDLRLVERINNVTGNTVGLFSVDPQSGANGFNWQSAYAVDVWNSSGSSRLVNPDYDGRPGDSDVYTHNNIYFGAQVAVSHSVEGCNAQNQAFITYFTAAPVLVSGGSFDQSP